MSQSTNNTFIESAILRRFNIIKKVGSGAYGHVWKVEDKTTKKIYALKKIFDAFQHSTDAQRTFRQVQILQQTNHPNIIKLYETIKAQNNKDVYLLFQFMEADLHNVIAQGILKDVHIRFITYQIAKALKYLHSGFVIHRDLKPSNILINSNCTVKLCDFGLVRSIINADQNNPVLTQGVATRWYRAPEVLLGSKCYSIPADIWSFGCIIYQILCQKPLFPGSSTLDQLERIIMFTSFPTEEDQKSLDSQLSKTMIKQIKINTSLNQSKQILKDLPKGFDDLLEGILVFNPKKRLTIQQILSHPLLKSFRKQQQQIISQKQITASIDDNKKLTVDQYRKLIYKNRKSTLGNSSSMPSIVNNNSNKKIQISKTNKNINDIFKNQKQNDGHQKQTLKNVKSHKQIRYQGSMHNSNKIQFKNQKQLLKTDSQKDISKVKYLPTSNNFYSPKNYMQIKKTQVQCCPWNTIKNTIPRENKDQQKQKQIQGQKKKQFPIKSISSGMTHSHTPSVYSLKKN